MPQRIVAAIYTEHNGAKTQGNDFLLRDAGGTAASTTTAHSIEWAVVFLS